VICGIDLSSFNVDAVFLSEDGRYLPESQFWVRVSLGKLGDAFDRSRLVFTAISRATFQIKGGYEYPLQMLFADCRAIGIEEPRGMNPGPTFRVQGAVLQTIPQSTLVHPWVPSQWRKGVGLKGNCQKEEIMAFVKDKIKDAADWPQDACDAWCIAEATRQVVR
jgi:hypothetical protein